MAESVHARQYLAMPNYYIYGTWFINYAAAAQIIYDIDVGHGSTALH